MFHQKISSYQVQVFTVTSSLHLQALVSRFVGAAAETRAHLTPVASSLRHAFVVVYKKHLHRLDSQANRVGAFGNGVGLAFELNRFHFWHTQEPCPF